MNVLENRSVPKLGRLTVLLCRSSLKRFSLHQETQNVLPVDSIHRDVTLHHREALDNLDRPLETKDGLNRELVGKKSFPILIIRTGG